MNLIDTLILQADQALRTLVPGATVAHSQNPADLAASADLSDDSLFIPLHSYADVFLHAYADVC